MAGRQPAVGVRHRTTSTTLGSRRGGGLRPSVAGQARRRPLGGGDLARPSSAAAASDRPSTSSITEEMARARAPELVGRIAINLVAPTLFAHGTPEQQERWLPPILPADELWCQLFSEPDAGSDLASLTTKAEKVEGGFRVTGRKVWTSYAQFADWRTLPRPQRSRRTEATARALVPRDRHARGRRRGAPARADHR